MNPVRHIAYLMRYWSRNRFVFKHNFTIRKFLNFLRAEWESRTMPLQVHSHPWDIFIDPVNSCPLTCPLCATGMRRQGRKKMMLSLEKYTQYLDPIAPWLYRVKLFNYGEPLLNPAIFDMIAYTKRHRIAVQINSNLNVWKNNFATRLVSCGLDTLVVSFDGVSQEAYQSYRAGGDIEKVTHALEELTAEKNRVASGKPDIVLQFLIQRHNEHEYDAVQQYAKKIGATFFPQPLTFDITDAAQREKWLPTDATRSHYDPIARNRRKQIPETRCGFLWNSPVINVDGGISPCCHVFYGSTDFGSLEKEPFREIWNNTAFREARRIQRERRLNDAAIVCNRCLNEKAFFDTKLDLINEYQSNLLK